ncbi:elongation of very long chain fatty acids protein 7-like [Condylostylus longicornis]|uniref:elongation of very long chain fatty acids protein 7-like n=1 Tax=Condylostylus longicornis TaxID=2530218 RepID=UPI00244E2B6A|nr:elongation of very long chain fatty acids protein 7-like [Condylostylus longicornis]
MAFVVKSMYNGYTYFINEHRDPRIDSLPLVSSPIPATITIVIYLLFVNKWGPKFMENRKPYKLKSILRIYNVLQVVFNLILFVTALLNSYFQPGFHFTCQNVDHSITEPYMRRLLLASYGYYLTKYLDLLDTVFFVLRKKNNQITFLHTYHHAGMVIGCWIFVKFLAGSHSTMLGLVNSFVHCIMYTYYFLTSLNKKFSTLWWKKYLTKLQLLQFGFLTIHFSLAIFNNWCNHPLPIAFIGFTQNIFIL